MKSTAWYGQACLLLFLAWSFSAKSQTVQWADRVVAFSTQASKTGHAAREALGEPTRVPPGGSCGCAWSPTNWDSSRYFTQRMDTVVAEYIKVGFAKPERVRKLWIAENYRPGSVRRIWLFNAQNQAELVYERGPFKRLAMGSRLWEIPLSKTKFKVTAVRLEVDATTNGSPSQIDAIGISGNQKTWTPSPDLAQEPVFYGLAGDPGPALNSRFAELLPRFSPDGQTLYFVRKDHPENYGGFFNDDIWVSQRLPDGSWSEALVASEALNNAYHNNVCGVSSDGVLTLAGQYFAEGGTAPGLSQSFRIRDRWNYPLNLDITGLYTGNLYAEYHMSRDRRVLLLSVQPIDSRGGRDLYVSTSTDQIHWSKPINLGAVLNTAGDEMAPWISDDGKTLYFSSDGHRGYGQQDVFVARRNGPGWTDWETPQNLGSKINGPGWDSHFVLEPGGAYAWFVQNKDALGNTDLVRIPMTPPLPAAAEIPPSAEAELTSPFEDRFLLFGYVRDGTTNQYLAASLRFWPADDSSRVLESTTNNSQYQVRMQDQVNIRVRLSAPGYPTRTESLRFDHAGANGVRRRDFVLYPAGYEPPAEQGLQLEAGKTVPLEGLQFRTNSSVIGQASYPALRELYAVLESDPSLQITLEGHTNDRCDARFCERLSKARAKKVATWLLDQGLDKNRVAWVGYGKEKPVADNNTEEGRSSNQRVDIRVH